MPKIKSSPKPKITLRELKRSEIGSIFPLINQHNPNITKPIFTKRLKAMLPLGYRALAAFDGKKMVAISGFWVGMRFWCGKQFDVDNFFVDKAYQGQKIGEQLMMWLEDRAIAEKCELIVLDVYADNFLAHRFYHRMGFATTGYHFTKIPGSRKPYMRTRPL